MHQLILFASGKGSNVQAIIDFFADNGKARVALIVCNNPGAGVLTIAEQYKIPVQMIDRASFKEEQLVTLLHSYQPSLIVLAGFLWKIPDTLVQAFPESIINIHPALLPKYGGKGMYGQYVHEAVLAAGEKESGITIHFVNEHYDEGAALVQARCALLPGDTAESIAARVGKLEHYFLPRTVEFLLDNRQ